MTKFNKILSVILAITLAASVASIGVYAATGDDVITIVKEIIERHVYYVDDVQVTESEFAAAQNQVRKETVEKTIEHKLYTETKYMLNGQYVTEDEYEAYIDGTKTLTGTTEVTFTATDLTGMNAGSLGDYLSFVENTDCAVIGAKVKSAKVKAVRYKFADAYLAHATQDADTGDYYFTDTTYSTSYQVVDSSVPGMHFKRGVCPTTNSEYYICDSDKLNTIMVDVNDFVFFFDYTTSVSPISFANIFESVTLIIE